MKRLWQNFSLRKKITSLISLLTVAIVFTLTLISIQLEIYYFHQDLENQADLLLETTSLSLRDPLYRLQLDELSDLARALNDNPNLTFFIVYDAQGKILVDSTRPDFLFSQVADPLGQILVSLKPTQVYKDWSADQFVSGRPVILGNQTIGAIAASLSTRPLNDKVADMTLENTFLALGTGLAGALLGFWLADQITKPLHELARSADQMSKGNLSVRVTSLSQDEIGQLAGVFNQMAASIQERETELRELAAGLERTVDERTAVLREQTVMLEQMAMADPLTKIFNRRHFFALAEKELEKALRYGHCLSIILIDADHFKRINDTYGHPFGDQVLINLASLLQANLRSIDILARYGGEEFILLLPAIGAEAAYITAERLRKIVAETFPSLNGQKLELTISLGVASWDQNPATDLTLLVARADLALYEAKHRGRNATLLWSPPSVPL